jgi:hypothetical protein
MAKAEKVGVFVASSSRIRTWLLESLSFPSKDGKLPGAWASRSGRCLVWGLLLLPAVLGGVGCGSSTGTVSGKVYYNGDLLKSGTVTFFTADGKSVPTGIREDGSYTLDKLAIGKAKVCVDTGWSDPQKLKAYSYAPPPGAKMPPGFKPPDAGNFVKIPAHYADPAKSDLTCEVAGGSQSYDIQLK